jgi:putative flippase GtrA
MTTSKAKSKSARKPAASNGLVKQGAKFGAVGISNTLIDFTVYTVINAVFHVPVSSAFKVKYISGTVAMINSFYWNRRWTFKSTVGVAKSGPKFLVATVVSVYVIQPAIVHFFTNSPGVNFGTFWYVVAATLGLGHVVTQKFVEQTVAFGMGVIGSAVWDFTLYKLWAFRK